MHVPRHHLVTEAEYLAMPETSVRMELLDGELIMAPSPGTDHQNIVGELFFALKTWARSGAEPAYIGLSPLDVRFGANRILQPDLFVLLGRSDAPERPIDVIPDLCIEVLSRNRAYDRITKRYVYAEAGVREFWAVEPLGLVERWHGEALGRSERVEDRLTSELLPGFAFDVGTLISPASNK